MSLLKVWGSFYKTFIWNRFWWTNRGITWGISTSGKVETVTSNQTFHDELVRVARPKWRILDKENYLSFPGPIYKHDVANNKMMGRQCPTIPIVYTKKCSLGISISRRISLNWDTKLVLKQPQNCINFLQTLKIAKFVFKWSIIAFCYWSCTGKNYKCF